MSNFLTIEGRVLARAMSVAMAVIENRNTIPVLSHVLLTLDKDGLIVTATDLDLTVAINLDVNDGAGDWSATVPAAILQSIARVAGPAIIRFEPGKDEHHSITVGHAEAFYTVHGLPTDSFPGLFGERGHLIETFTNGMLASQLARVQSAISKEETRYYLNGVCWDIGGDARKFVATDGHRLLVCRYSNDPGEEDARIIPRKTVEFIVKHFAGKDVKVFASKDKNKIEIVSPGVALYTKLIDGTFPNYGRVIPKTVNYSLEFKRAEFLQALAKVSVLSLERGRAIKFSNDNGRAALEVNNHDFGSAKAVTSAEWPMNAGSSFGFNGQYLRDMASSCDENMVMLMIDAGAPCIISDGDKTMTRVLMPMRI